MNKEIRKFIDFIITQKCTYKCRYCSQSKCQNSNASNANKQTILAFYKLLEKLEPDCEITITGGEAMLHPDFFEIIKKIKEMGFKINLITNLSFKIEQYQKVFEVLGSSLNCYDISFHLDEVQNFKLMLEKLMMFIRTKPRQTKVRFFIPLYNVTEKKELKIDKIISIAKRFSIEYEFQRIRFLNGYKYDDFEKYPSKHRLYNTFSSMCHAGSKSAVIYEDGSVYRCYSSRFLKSNYLGNLKDMNFRLNSCAQPCNSSVCSCPKPLDYNQIEDESDIVGAFKNIGLNLLYLPSLIFKNRLIVLNKIMQFFS